MENDFTKDYSQFNSQDFATDDVFRAWVIDNDPKAKAFWQYWLLENPSKTSVIDEAKKILTTVQYSQLPITEAEVGMAVGKIMRQIDAREMGDSGHKIRLFASKTYQIMAMAATVLLAVWGTWWWFSNQKRQNTEGGNKMITLENIEQKDKEKATNPANILLEKFNDKTQPLTLTLNDGSIVTLEKGSKLIYPSIFDNDNRTVTLTGSAFFDVVKNPSKPFLVKAQGVVTKVLGTSFKVNAYDKNVKVIVKTGKVAVFTDNKDTESDNEKKAIVLTPNQEAVFQSAANRFEKSVQEVPTLLITNVKIKDLHFEDAPVVGVFNALKEAYGIDIIFDEDVLKDCLITTSLTDEPLFEKLTIICKTIGAKYRQLDAKIIINGRGCK